MKINTPEIEFSDMSTGDEVGRILYYKGEIYRAIYPSQVEKVKELFSSGLINELVSETLIPPTEISELELDGYGLILHHARIQTITYPYEWSFEMLRDAALLVLRVNSVAKKYGYQTKDCHSFNVIFEGARPVYADLGSFVKTNAAHWLCYEEFLKSYQYMLEIGSMNEYHWVKQLSSTDLLISHESFFLFKHSILRSFSLKNIKRIVSLWRFLNINDNTYDDKLKQKLGVVGSFILAWRKRNLFPFRNRNLESIERHIKRIKKLSYQTVWGDYQSNFDENNTRFGKIISILQNHQIKTGFEAAGNQGFFANLLIQKAGFERIYCSDYDENAVDAMYQRYRGEKRLSPILMSFLFRNQTSFTLPPEVRFRSDIVIALAVSHHILLTQKQSVDFFFKSLKSYTHRYIAVEYMPMGLWDSVSNTAPPVPEWYTVEWFRSAFLKHFDVIHEEEIWKNRYLFFGQLKK